MDICLAALLPPLAVFLRGTPSELKTNLWLTLAFWLPGMVHAEMVVHRYHVQRRSKRRPQLGKPNPFGLR